MSKENLLQYEEEYAKALSLAREKKKLALTKTIEHEELVHLEALGLEGWSEEERIATYNEGVVPYWEKFGYVPKRFWFELFGTRDNRMDPRFMPTDFYYAEIMPYICNAQQWRGLTNKAYVEYIFSDVKQPRTVILKSEGAYLDEKRNLISEDKAVALCLERKTDLFVKVSSGTSGGSGISIIKATDSTADDVRKIFRATDPSFIVQEKVDQHPVLDSINSNSISTIRILSLLMDDKVYIESAALRIAGPDTPFMKIYDDGVTTEILEDGRLHPRVFSDLGKWYDNGRGYFDDSLKVPAMDKIYEEVRRIHPRVGHFKCVGWDFAVDREGNHLLLEYNAYPALGCTQITRCKPVFNERTDWILEDYFERRTWAKNHRQDLLIQ